MFKSLILALTALLILPVPSYAWHDYTYHNWDWHGSGRDYAYSYYIDNYYTAPGYAFEPLDSDLYFNTAVTPAITPLPLQPMQVIPVNTDEITVNVPNARGGYTPVVIKRSGNGFTGPQGEYYPDFPKVSQLKIMYGQ